MMKALWIVPVLHIALKLVTLSQSIVPFCPFRFKPTKNLLATMRRNAGSRGLIQHFDSLRSLLRLTELQDAHVIACLPSCFTNFTSGWFCNCRQENWFVNRGSSGLGKTQKPFLIRVFECALSSGSYVDTIDFEISFRVCAAQPLPTSLLSSCL